MAKPVLLTVDDDAEVLRAVERDLRRRYAERYRVLRADSGAAALEALQGLKRRNAPVGLLLVDQRMPQMTGVEFLAQAMELFPNTKRVRQVTEVTEPSKLPRGIMVVLVSCTQERETEHKPNDSKRERRENYHESSRCSGDR